MKIMKSNEILQLLEENKKEVKNFADVLNLSNNLDRHLNVGSIDDETGDIVEDIIRFWNKVDDDAGIPVEERQPIKIYINSEGGSLLATFTIMDAIRLSKTPVYTINVGIAYSGGFFTFICGHKRFTYPHSSFLFHEGNMTLGNMDANKFRNAADFYDKQLDLIEKVVLEKTKISQESYDKHRKDDWWILANEALELGICDEIVDKFI